MAEMVETVAMAVMGLTVDMEDMVLMAVTVVVVEKAEAAGAFLAFSEVAANQVGNDEYFSWIPSIYSDLRYNISVWFVQKLTFSFHT